MKLVILYPLIYLVFLTSCVNTKIVEENKVMQRSNIEKNENSTYIFQNCESKATCDELFDCYHTYLLSEQPFEYNNLKESWNYFNIDSLLECTLAIYKHEAKKKDLAAECFYSFYNNMHLTEKAKGKGVSPYTGIHYKILTNWNSRKSFEICLQFSSIKDLDRWGDVECTNRSIRFINLVLLPKIQTINNKTPDQFYIDLVRHLNPDKDFDADCYNSVYKIVYPAIKKAWDEGKIVLKTDNTH